MPDGTDNQTAGRSAMGGEAAELLRPVIDAARDRPYVIAQLGQSLDGRIATPTGASRWINGGAALDHLHRLRASVDAVVVGAGTVVADDPLLTVRRVSGKNPARVIIDPNGRIAAGARALTDDGARRIIVCGARERALPAGVEMLSVTQTPRGTLDPAAIVAELFELGITKVLIEGGAKTVSAFIDANSVDRLHVMVAPMILGSGMPGLSLKAIATLDQARRPRTSVHVLDDGDVLFDCDLKQSL